MEGNAGATARPQLSDAKRALLEARLKGTAKAAPRRDAITRRGGGPVYPMSYAQERLWFMDQLVPNSPFYHLPAAGRIPAAVDVPTLARALTEIARRHEALRTVFRLEDGKPVQVVLEPAPVAVPVEDLRGPNGEPAPDELVRRKADEEGSRPFDLGTGPLWRIKLFRISEADYAQVLTMHHIITDGWSSNILGSEMAMVYNAFAAGEPSPLPELQVQYADYSAWQREYLEGAVMKRQVDHWKAHLSGAPTLELPTDRPRPAVQGYRGGNHRFLWPAAFADRLRALATGESVSMNMLVMSAFYALLHHYSGQDDIVVGTLLGNRNRAEVEPLIGFFVNTAAIRVSLEDDPPFRELIQRVRAAVLDADANQEVPFDIVVEALGVGRDLSRNPLFQVMYFHHTLVRTAGQLEVAALAAAPGSRLETSELFPDRGIASVETGTTKFDLTLTTMDSVEGMSNLVEYDSDLFDHETIVRMADHLRTLLENALDDADARVSRIPLTTAEERAALLAAPPAPAPTGERIHDLFRGQAQRTPHAVALVAGGRRTTYAELEAASNRLARRLQALGVGPETNVAIALDRTAELPTALLAVLKAGGAYVPLDPAYPAERLAYMVADAGARVVVTQAAHAPLFAGTDAVLLRVDAEAEAIAALDASPADGGAAAENRAYVIYTSGSTGRPKGVEVEHRSTVAFLRWYRETMPAEELAAHLGGTSVTFDVSVAEIFGTLTAGGTLWLVENALSLAELGEEAGIRLATMVPNAAAELLRMGGIPSTVASLNLGGEALPLDVAQGLLATGTVKTVRNCYGPTEDTTYTTVWTVPADARKVLIGRPIDGTRLHVLDRSLAPVPAGVPGEVYLSGAGLARGYLGRPGLTAERFLPDPFSAEPGARTFRVLDRARRLPSGEIDYLGRTDGQVKVRGYRIELGEVEHRLREHPAVAEAVAGVREGGSGGAKRLVAWLVAAPGAEAPSPADLRLWMRETLPEYMVPAAFVAVEALPRTSSGKLDRSALPAPEAPVSAEAAEATNDAEATLLEIWKDVLRVERIGIHDNFFDLGGDSILAINMIGKAGKAGLRITARQTFQHQTVAELAAVAGTAAAVEAEQGPVTGPAPLTPVQRWFLEQDHPEPHHFNLSFVFAVRERLDPALLERAVAATLEHHDALRLRFRRTADGWEQEGAAPGGPTPFEAVDLSAQPDADAAMDAHGAGVQSGLDLEHGPLARFALYDRGPDAPQRLLLAVHHLVMDAVSLGVVLEDLEAAYRAAAAGTAPALPAKTTSYRRWAERLAEHARSEAARAELGWWTDPARARVAPLPRDRAVEATTEGSASRFVVALDAETTQALLSDVPPVYGTQVNDVLLAGLAAAFARWTGRRELLVDLEGHGREDLFENVELTRTVGWFTAIYPVLLRLSDPDAPGEALKEVKETLRAVPGRGVGYGLLRWMGGDASAELAALPPAEVSFNYLGQFGALTSGDALFTLVDEAAGPPRAASGIRPHLLQVDAVVSGGMLHATWTYSRSAHDPATVRRVAEGFMAELRAIVAHCRDPQAGGFTPSDFPLAGLDQASLDALLGL